MRAFILSSTLLLALAPLSLRGSGVTYDVEFEGIEDSRTLKDIKRASQLTSLKKRPPTSLNALRYRADSDIPTLIKVLESHGYYEAQVSIQIHETYGQNEVVVRINPGPRYELDAFDIHLYCESKEVPGSCCSLSLDEIGIRLHKPAITAVILDGELKVLQRLSECGYPLAKVEDRQVVVDGKTKSVRVALDVKTGRQVEFGAATVQGNTRVKDLFIDRKIAWKVGDTYDSRLIDTTQSSLIDSGLFSSVLITHDAEPSADGQLPLRIEVSETKHKSVNVGASYQTVFGFGATFGWENRNVGGMGRTLSFQGDVTRISQTGIATYVHPDFNCLGQDMIAKAQAAHEDIFAYSLRSYSLMDRFERTVNRRLRGSLGLRGDRLFVTESVHNGNYWLVEVPFYLRWSSSNSLLNPTRGATLEYTVTPAFNSAEVNEIYLTQAFTASMYKSIAPKERIVLAQKLTLGCILSNGLDSIPLSNRFLGGSEEDLRGYRYRSVSPLVRGKPVGGRSAVYYTFETRLRLTEILGLVPFFDIGNVYKTQYPSLKGKWLKSAGIGLRFFTFMGPFRVDLAFPLNPRKHIDPRYEILVSIGQMF
jgi:translocation and assembly module TamA